jgi:hypothetical protein
MVETKPINANTSTAQIIAMINKTSIESPTRDKPENPAWGF